MVGLFHTTAPLGPHICTPSRLITVLAACGVVSKRHTGLPVSASSAAMPPCVRQHSCVGRPAAATSKDDSGTYRRPSKYVMGPLMIEVGNHFTRSRQRSVPLLASTAYTVAVSSAKNSVLTPSGVLSSVSAECTGASVLNDQRTQPL